jgi:hypothetical protein
MRGRARRHSLHWLLSCEQPSNSKYLRSGIWACRHTQAEDHPQRLIASHSHGCCRVTAKPVASSWHAAFFSLKPQASFWPSERQSQAGTEGRAFVLRVLALVMADWLC